MGGFGSGRHSGSGFSAYVDAGLKLDLNRLVRSNLIPPCGRGSGTLQWSIVGTGEKTASMGYEINTLTTDDMWMRVYYSHTPYGGEKTDMDYKIKLIATVPQYGGKRFWFICPFTGKKASVLYSPPGNKWFGSRAAFKRLRFRSQSRSAKDRAIDNMWKHKNKIGGYERFPERPKGMHKKTFQRLIDKTEEAESAADVYLWLSLARFCPDLLTR